MEYLPHRESRERDHAKENYGFKMNEKKMYKFLDKFLMTWLWNFNFL